jgi:hypothetical protein
MDELRSSSLSLIQRSSLVPAETPGEPKNMFSDLDDMSSTIQMSTNEIRQRPIKDPRQAALNNIENRSALGIHGGTR